MKFTVGPNAITLVSLGRFVVSGNAGTHTLKLVNPNTGVDVPNGSVSILLAGAAAGDFLYTNLGTPLFLPANTSYFLVSQETSGGDRWASGSTTVTTTGAANCEGTVSGNSNGWDSRQQPGTTFVPVDF